MVDAEIVLARLAALRTNLNRLQKCIEPGRETFVAEEDRHGRCRPISASAIPLLMAAAVLAGGLDAALRTRGFDTTSRMEWRR